MDNQTNNPIKESAMERGLLSSTTDPNGIIQQIVTRPFSEEYKRDTAYNASRKQMRIRVYISAADRNYLSNEVYPYLDLDFVATSGSGHGLANARRVIEQELAVSRCSKHQRVVDVGGNFYLYIVMGRENIHCCCPKLGIRDCSRKSTRMLELDTWVRDVLASDSGPNLDSQAVSRRNAKKQRAEAVLKNPGHFFCWRMSQHCFVQADVLLFLDSLYDIPVDDIAEIMFAHKAKKGYGYFIFEPEMLIDDSGFIRGLNCEWEKKVVKTPLKIGDIEVGQTESIIIEYRFLEDSSWNYRHDYNNLVLLASKQKVTYKDNHYVIERLYEHGIVRLDITQVESISIPSTLSFSYWKSGYKNRVGVRVFDLDGLSRSSTTKNIKSQIAWVDTALVQQLVSYGLRLQDEKFTPKTLYDYAVGVNARFTVNGVDVTVKVCTDTMLAYRISFSLWWIAFVLKFDQNYIQSVLVRREQKRRNLRVAGLTKLMLMRFTEVCLGSKWMAALEGENGLFTRFEDGLVQHLSRSVEASYDLPNPEIVDIDPLIAFEEIFDSFESRFEVSTITTDEFQNWSSSYEKLVEPMSIIKTLDLLADRIRATEPGKDREILEDCTKTLLRRLAVLDPERHGRITASWSVREDVQRVLDSVLPLSGGPVGSSKELSQLAGEDGKDSESSDNDSVTPSQSASQTCNCSHKKPKRKDGDDDDDDEGELPPVKSSQKPKKAPVKSPQEPKKAHVESQSDELIMTSYNKSKSGEAGMASFLESCNGVFHLGDDPKLVVGQCGVGAVLGMLNAAGYKIANKTWAEDLARAEEELGEDEELAEETVRALLHRQLTEDEVREGLIKASNNSRTDWFDHADIETYLAQLGFRLALVVIEKDVLIYVNPSDPEAFGLPENAPTLYIAHVNRNHWNSIVLGESDKKRNYRFRIEASNGGADFGDLDDFENTGIDLEAFLGETGQTLDDLENFELDDDIISNLEPKQYSETKDGDDKKNDEQTTSESAESDDESACSVDSEGQTWYSAVDCEDRQEDLMSADVFDFGKQKPRVRLPGGNTTTSDEVHPEMEDCDESSLADTESIKTKSSTKKSRKKKLTKRKKKSAKKESAKEELAKQEQAKQEQAKQEQAKQEQEQAKEDLATGKKKSAAEQAQEEEAQKAKMATKEAAERAKAKRAAREAEKLRKKQEEEKAKRKKQADTDDAQEDSKSETSSTVPKLMQRISGRTGVTTGKVHRGLLAKGHMAVSDDPKPAEEPTKKKWTFRWWWTKKQPANEATAKKDEQALEQCLPRSNKNITARKIIFSIGGGLICVSPTLAWKIWGTGLIKFGWSTLCWMTGALAKIAAVAWQPMLFVVLPVVIGGGAAYLAIDQQGNFSVRNFTSNVRSSVRWIWRRIIPSQGDSTHSSSDGKQTRPLKTALGTPASLFPPAKRGLRYGKRDHAGLNGPYRNGWKTLEQCLAETMDQMKDKTDNGVTAGTLAALGKRDPNANAKPLFTSKPDEKATDKTKDGSTTGEKQVDVDDGKQMSQVDKDRILLERTKALVGYLSYVQMDVKHFTKFCADVYRDVKTRGDARGRYADYRYPTSGAQLLEQKAGGYFYLEPGLASRKEALTGLSTVWVPDEDFKGDGQLIEAEYDAQKHAIKAKTKSTMILYLDAMNDYLSHRLLQVHQQRTITEVDPTRKFTLVNGVPGCGKSSEICRVATPQDLIAVVSTGGRDDLQAKFTKAGKRATQVRTVGSREMGQREYGKTIYIDEGLMCHKGLLVYIAELVGARHVKVYGDDQQLGFKPRVPGYEMEDYDLGWIVEYRSESKTATQDTVVALGQLKVNGKGNECDGKGYYPNGFTTINPVVKSIYMRTIQGGTGEIPKDPEAKYLTWTQEDKRKLIAAGFKNANTINEFEGGRANHVILVRLAKKMDLRLRTDSEQLVVGISRHTERFDYVTVEQTAADADLIKMTIDRLNLVEDLAAAYGAHASPQTDRC